MPRTATRVLSDLHGMAGKPKRLLGWNELDRDLGHEGPEPIRTINHACLLGDHVAEQDEGFWMARGDAVARVLHQFPFTRFACDEDVDVRPGEEGDTRHPANKTPTRKHSLDWQL